MRKWLVWGIVAALAAGGCGGGDGDARVRMAERDLAAKQDALAAAYTNLTTQAGTFCRSSAGYVTALDRYGDLITSTAPTVGDVTEAGADLTDPRAEVVAAAEQVAAAREQVATAEKELAEATADLAGARAAAAMPTAAPEPSAAPVSPPAAPPVEPATLSRVKQADADFTAAREGITDQTPLRQAAERFNAAAVALEMSWLRLLGEVGCLTDEQKSRAAGYTTAVQKSLTEAGYYAEKVDGVYGPATVAAVRALQKAHELPETGAVDKATDAALQEDLRAKGGAAAEDAIATTAAVQQTLKLAGYWTGPVDGAWTAALTGALTSFQTAMGVEPTGTVDAATVAAVENALRRPSPSPSISR